MKKYSIIAGIVTIAATMFGTNTFASLFWTHQPKTPKCLK